jgi:murein L,D-transpeptidase YafK
MGTGIARRLVAAAAVLTLAACSQTEVAPHLRPLGKDAIMLLGKKSMKVEQPIFVRVFKEESELEVWKQRDDGRFYHFKTYPICNYSGDLGPKKAQGDKQAPEGFYKVSRQQMNPKSQFHLAFNLGYPNVYDKAHKRTGDFLMVHGKCKSAGCYAMTDALIEEIYALAREAFIGGQETFEVHAFPYRMTDANLARHQASEHLAFWKVMKQGYDYFETTRQLPAIAVCERRYVVNPKWRNPIIPAKLDAERACPAYDQVAPEPFKLAPKDQVADVERVVAPGVKSRIAGGGDRNGGMGDGSAPESSGASNILLGLGNTSAAKPAGGSLASQLGFR